MNSRFFLILYMLMLGFFTNSNLVFGSEDSCKMKFVTIDTFRYHIEILDKEVNIINTKISNLGNSSDHLNLDKSQWVVIFFMPIIMLFFSIIFMIKFRKSDDLKFSKIIGFSNVSNGKNDPALSTSRFILILTGLTSIIVVTTLVMYYGYIMVTGSASNIPVDDLWKILAGLGIGIIPYGINVWSKNEKENTSHEPSDS